MSTSSMASARSSTWSGTVSRTCTCVICATTSLRLSTCCTFSVVKTSMPASSSSSTSCQRLRWREPGAFVCASSSTSSRLRLARQGRVEVELLQRAPAVLELLARQHLEAPSTSGPSRSGRASPRARRRRRRLCSFTRSRATCSMRYVLPTPGAKPKKTFSFAARAALLLAATRRKERVGIGSAEGSFIVTVVHFRGTAVEGEVEAKHVDARLAEDPQLRPSVCASTSRVHEALRRGRVHAPRAPPGNSAPRGRRAGRARCRRR